MNFRKGVLVALCLTALSIAIPQGKVFAQEGVTWCSAHKTRFIDNCMECRSVQSKIAAKQRKQAARAEKQRELQKEKNRLARLEAQKDAAATAAEANQFEQQISTVKVTIYYLEVDLSNLD